MPQKIYFECKLQWATPRIIELNPSQHRPCYSTGHTSTKYLFLFFGDCSCESIFFIPSKHPLQNADYNRKCSKTKVCPFFIWSDLVLVNEGGIEVFNVLT